MLVGFVCLLSRLGNQALFSVLKWALDGHQVWVHRARTSMEFSIVCIFLQLLFIALFAGLAEYGEHAVPYHKRVGEGPDVTGQRLGTNDIQTYYGSKRNTHPY